MNFRIQGLQERFKGFEDFRILSFTVDPDHDTVEVLQKYAERMNAQDGLWYFFTGERDALYRTAGHYLLSAQEDSTADGGFLHSEQIVLIDWEGRIRSRKDDNGNVVGSYNALDETQMRDLTDDIKVLIAEFEKEKAKREYRASKNKKD
jgi:protein SCO1/2